jgi:outer membrane protein assembly factor BamB
VALAQPTWVLAGGTQQQPRASEKLSLSRPLNVVWSYSAGEISGFPSTTHQETLYLPLGTSEVAALNLSTGELRWKTDLGGHISASPASDDRGVYVASEVPPEAPGREVRGSGVVRLLSPQSGVTIWMKTISAPIRGALSVSANALFAASEDGRIMAFDKQTGEIIWTRQNNAPFLSQPLLVANNLFWGDESGQIFLVDGASGQTHWRYQTHSRIRSQPVTAGGRLYVGATDDFVYALDAATGVLLWRVRAGSGVQALATDEERLFVAALDNFVYCISAETGRRVWKRQMPGRVAAKPVVAEGGVLFAPLSGEECIVLNPENGKKINSIKVEGDGQIAASPLLADGLLLITTRQGVYALSSAKVTSTNAR